MLKKNLTNVLVGLLCLQLLACGDGTELPSVPAGPTATPTPTPTPQPIDPPELPVNFSVVTNPEFVLFPQINIHLVAVVGSNDEALLTWYFPYQSCNVAPLWFDGLDIELWEGDGSREDAEVIFDLAHGYLSLFDLDLAATDPNGNSAFKMEVNALDLRFGDVNYSLEATLRRAGGVEECMLLKDENGNEDATIIEEKFRFLVQFD